ncbi:MAG: PIN domain-containing protein [Desulfuromonadales bacterium]
MKILLDTNIFLDILLQRSPFFQDSHRIFKLAENGLVVGYIAPITINNIAYIARKSHQPDQIRKYIVIIAEIFTICQMNAAVVTKAAALNFTDIEDSLQATMAESNDCDFIITSNISDYQHSPVPALTASVFLKQFASP